MGEKLKKYLRFLSLSNDLAGEAVNKKIDSIWAARNDIAHASSKALSLKCGEIECVYNPNINAEEYTQFALYFIELVDDTIEFLTNVDKLSLEKWKTTDATLLHKNNKA